MYSVHHKTQSLCGWGINVPWWLHTVVPTHCSWTCNQLSMLYVSVALRLINVSKYSKDKYVDISIFTCMGNALIY